MIPLKGKLIKISGNDLKWYHYNPYPLLIYRILYLIASLIECSQLCKNYNHTCVVTLRLSLYPVPYIISIVYMAVCNSFYFWQIVLPSMPLVPNNLYKIYLYVICTMYCHSPKGIYLKYLTFKKYVVILVVVETKHKWMTVKIKTWQQVFIYLANTS